jgi:hypothetical protein
MKQVLVMCALALTATLTATTMTTMAHASNETARDTKTFRFDFSCNFTKTAMTTEDGTTFLDPEDPATFLANARVFADVDTDHVTMDSLRTSRNQNNYISISRNGNLLFADSAVLFSNVHDVVITGSNGVSPSITVKRDNKPMTDLGATPMCYDSWLHFGDRHGIPGQCCVKTTPVVLTENASALQ